VKSLWDDSLPAMIRPRELTIGQYHGRGTLYTYLSTRHYLGYCPPGHRIAIAVSCGPVLLGGMLWGRPLARNEDQKHTLELTRFYLDDRCGKNSETYCLARARRIIKKALPEITRLIAYSDPGAGHDGVIYKADNWKLAGESAGGNWASSRPRKEYRAIQGKKLKWERNI